MSAFDPGHPPVLYPIIDPDVCRARGLDPVAVSRACLVGGARLLQLRCKGTSGGAFLAMAEELVRVARPYRAQTSSSTIAPTSHG